MSRWEPDAGGRMVDAAMELFAERGFEQTTAGDIADRAGVTERTFFRHFADKREVLFAGTQATQEAVYDAIASGPADATPLDAALAGVEAFGAVIEERREHAVRRSKIVASHPSLQERELLKLATTTAWVADALRARGVDVLTAELAARSAVAVFQVAFARWIAEAEPPAFAECVAEAAAALRALR